ncbi:hypothetical protein [Bacteroides sedimenti]|uniref:hypothetical protein n=1 Tax=Bacteroides sedimenti TaxID=2136147 RepID=UPI00333F2703
MSGLRQWNRMKQVPLPGVVHGIAAEGLVDQYDSLPTTCSGLFLFCLSRIGGYATIHDLFLSELLSGR